MVTTRMATTRMVTTRMATTRVATTRVATTRVVTTTGKGVNNQFVQPVTEYMRSLYTPLSSNKVHTDPNNTGCHIKESSSSTHTTARRTYRL